MTRLKGSLPACRRTSTGMRASKRFAPPSGSHAQAATKRSSASASPPARTISKRALLSPASMSPRSAIARRWRSSWRSRAGTKTGATAKRAGSSLTCSRWPPTSRSSYRSFVENWRRHCTSFGYTRAVTPRRLLPPPFPGLKINARSMLIRSSEGQRLLPFLAPLLTVVGALLVLLVAGMEIYRVVREHVDDNIWPAELTVHALLAFAVILIIAAVFMTQRAVRRTAAAETAMRESEERLRLVANNVPALISYVDREQR